MYTPMTGRAEVVTASGTAGGLTAASLAGATKAEIDVQSASVRFYTDGSTPTATAGRRAGRDAVIVLKGAEIAGFKVIRETGVSATLSVVYYTGEPGPTDY